MSKAKQEKAISRQVRDERVAAVKGAVAHAAYAEAVNRVIYGFGKQEKAK